MIRLATSEDVPRLVAMGSAMHLESNYREQPYLPEKVAGLMQHLITDPSGAVFVSVRDGVVTGAMAGGIAANWFNDEPVAYEYALFMDPAQRHGISAMKLVNAFAGWCELRGAARLRVGITTGVAGAERIYRALGFQDDGIFLTKEF